jgi:preprotein translocase subunit SecG
MAYKIFHHKEVLESNARKENQMTLNKLTLTLAGMFVTGAVFFSILLRRSEQIREELHQLREERKMAV